MEAASSGSAECPHLAAASRQYTLTEQASASSTFSVTVAQFWFEVRVDVTVSSSRRHCYTVTLMFVTLGM